MARALDATLNVVFSTVVTTGGNPVTITPISGWTLRPAISINLTSPPERRYQTSATPPAGTSTFDVVLLARNYNLNAPVEGVSQPVTATVTGRYEDSGGMVTYFSTATFYVTGTTNPPMLGTLLPSGSTYIGPIISGMQTTQVNAQWAAYRSTRSVPAGTRIQEYPSGLEEVIAEDSSTAAYAALATNPLRSSYCGASRVMPVYGSISGTAFVAVGTTPTSITGVSP